MKVAAFVFLGLFTLASIIQCYFAFVENDKYRKITKPICLAFLSISAILFVPTSPLVYIAALCGLVGDILLLSQKKIFFVFGTLAFLAGHFLYISQIILLYNFTLSPYVLIFVPVGLLVLAFLLYPLDKKLAGPVTIFGNYYIPFLFVCLTASIILFINGKLGGLFISIGYVLFIVSDLFLIFSSFVKPNIKRKHFYVMLSYLLAQFFIIFGFVLALGAI